MQEMNLHELAELLGDQIDGWKYYYQRETGNIIEIEEKYLSIARDRIEGEVSNDGLLTPKKEELVEIGKEILLFPKEYVMLPTKWQVNTFELMKGFAEYIDDEGIQGALLEALESGQPELAFRDEAMEYGVDEHWHDYFMERILAIAEQWCDRNEIPVE